jgi:hypothetical protein
MSCAFIFGWLLFTNAILFWFLFDGAFSGQTLARLCFSRVAAGLRFGEKKLNLAKCLSPVCSLEK